MKEKTLLDRIYKEELQIPRSQLQSFMSMATSSSSVCGFDGGAGDEPYVCHIVWTKLISVLEDVFKICGCFLFVVFLYECFSCLLLVSSQIRK